MSARRWVLTGLATLVFGGCSDAATPVVTESLALDRAALMDPEACKDCHPNHYAEWSGSMHAYASEDPVFLAMNARGQRETDGELGDFCVKCHAPMAVLTGATTDGLNLPELGRELQGVTCYFCHSVTEVTGTHNAPLGLADDDVMRGGISDPRPNTAHASAYSPLLDGSDVRSALLCGSCHDIVTPAGVHLERTYQEWLNTLYSKPVPGKQQTCASCHMEGRDDVAADYDGVFLRRVHSHAMPGVDTALTPFPQLEEQAALVQRDLDNVVLPQLCVTEGPAWTNVLVTLENLAAGHSWPSGASQDRRAWVEVVAYQAGEVVYQSGVVGPQEAVAELDDPDLWRLGDRLYGEDGEEVHMFWDAVSVESELLPGPTAFSNADPEWIDTHVTRVYDVPGELPDRVTLAVHVRAMGREVLQDLVDSGDLAPEYVDAIPTWTLAASQLEWTPDLGTSCLP